jgi:hypothetical protein
MRTLTAEEIDRNYNILLSKIDTYISEPRRTKLKNFYLKYQDRLMLMPASHKKEYHNAFPGGYVEHVLRVIECALDINNVWIKHGVDNSTYTIEELVFAALNHDLGKMGDEENEAYIPQTDNWRKDKLGEDYMFNNKLEFCSVPDRGLFLLQSNNIQYTMNEMLAIQTHDGLYDEGNKKYLISWGSEQKPRTSLIYILHQADLMAARIEWEMDWLDGLKKGSLSKDMKVKEMKPFTLDKKNKALGSIKNEGLKSALDKI